MDGMHRSLRLAERLARRRDRASGSPSYRRAPCPLRAVPAPSSPPRGDVASSPGASGRDSLGGLRLTPAWSPDRGYGRATSGSLSSPLPGPCRWSRRPARPRHSRCNPKERRPKARAGQDARRLDSPSPGAARFRLRRPIGGAVPHRRGLRHSPELWDLSDCGSGTRSAQYEGDDWEPPTHALTQGRRCTVGDGSEFRHRRTLGLGGDYVLSWGSAGGRRPARGRRSRSCRRRGRTRSAARGTATPGAPESRAG